MRVGVLTDCLRRVRPLTWALRLLLIWIGALGLVLLFYLIKGANSG